VSGRKQKFIDSFAEGIDVKNNTQFHIADNEVYPYHFILCCFPLPIQCWWVIRVRHGYLLLDMQTQNQRYDTTGVAYANANAYDWTTLFAAAPNAGDMIIL
jgi:hypothetical protein